MRSYGEGCETSPVGYIEGWYVDPDLRQKGLGGLLFQAAEDWARSEGHLVQPEDQPVVPVGQSAGKPLTEAS